MIQVPKSNLNSICRLTIFTLLLLIITLFTSCTEIRNFFAKPEAPNATTSATGTILLDQLIDATNELKSNEEALLRYRNDNLKMMKLENEFKDWVSDEQLKKLLDDQRKWLRNFYSSNFSEKEIQKLVEMHTSKEWNKLLEVNRSQAAGGRPVAEYFNKLNKEVMKYRKEMKRP